jgi:hypothetical protein
VGTDRRILAARYARQIVIAPDNGLLTLLDQRLGLEGLVSVRNESYFLASRIGRTFDGRDIMAPVAAALATGTRLEQLGPTPESYKLLDLPAARAEGSTIIGHVLHVDRFGNCVTNISRSMIEQVTRTLGRVEVVIGQRSIGPLHGTFSHVPVGEALALLDSIDLLEIAVNGGRASDRLQLRVGDEVQVRYSRAEAVVAREKALPPQGVVTTPTPAPVVKIQPEALPIPAVKIQPPPPPVVTVLPLEPVSILTVLPPMAPPAPPAPKKQPPAPAPVDTKRPAAPAPVEKKQPAPPPAEKKQPAAPVEKKQPPAPAPAVKVPAEDDLILSEDDIRLFEQGQSPDDDLLPPIQLD